MVWSVQESQVNKIGLLSSDHSYLEPGTLTYHRPKFASSKEIEQLAVNFVMVKSADESEFADEQFSPDGGYIPRILFFDDAGRHMEDIVQREDKYKASLY